MELIIEAVRKALPKIEETINQATQAGINRQSKFVSEVSYQLCSLLEDQVFFSMTLAALNHAFRKDPNAIHALVCNWVPCNQALAEDEFVQVGQSMVLPDGNYQVGTLGLVNAILAANGLPLVAAQFSNERDEHGRAKMIGFCKYERPVNID